MKKKQLKHLIAVAAGQAPADLRITNCHVLDVFNKEFFEGDILIAEGRIASLDGKNLPEAAETLDGEGCYLVPGFIDGHAHIESSHVSPPEFSSLVVPRGTTTVIADPHEIVNVCGLDGFDYMLWASEGLPLSVFLQIPSCVPCSPFEDSGAELDAGDIAARMKHPRVLGLGEMMDFPGVCAGNDEVLDKIMAAKDQGKVIDGHYLGSEELLDAYCTTGVLTDHESSAGNELRSKVRRGVYVLMRQGTACHDLLNLVGGVDAKNADRIMMCTDDCAAGTILAYGHIDHNVRLAIGAGIDPVDANISINNIK